MGTQNYVHCTQFIAQKSLVEQSSLVLFQLGFLGNVCNWSTVAQFSSSSTNGIWSDCETRLGSFVHVSIGCRCALDLGKRIVKRIPIQIGIGKTSFLYDSVSRSRQLFAWYRFHHCIGSWHLCFVFGFSNSHFGLSSLCTVGRSQPWCSVWILFNGNAIVRASQRHFSGRLCSMAESK